MGALDEGTFCHGPPKGEALQQPQRHDTTSPTVPTRRDHCSKGSQEKKVPSSAA